MNNLDNGKKIAKPYFGCETTLFGTTFRSKLEAEWAVFFTVLGLRWEYEPIKVKTRHGGYIPDFTLPDLHSGMLCEVKPKGRDAEDHMVTMAKMTDACTNLGKYGTILRGNPYQFCVEDTREYGGWVGGSHTFYCDDSNQDEPYQFCVCPHCWKVGYEFDGRGERVCRGACGQRRVLDPHNFDHLGHGDKGYSFSHPRILIAAKMAQDFVWMETR